MFVDSMMYTSMITYENAVPDMVDVLQLAAINVIQGEYQLRTKNMARIVSKAVVANPRSSSLGRLRSRSVDYLAQTGKQPEVSSWTLFPTR